MSEAKPSDHGRTGYSDVKIREQVYKDPRPAEYFDRFHERSRTRDPGVVYETVRLGTTVLAWTLFRLRAAGAERVPAEGPVILAPNHFSFMDHFFLALALRRKVRFMAKSQLFSPPLERVFSNGGVFPVRRGYHDEEAFVTSGAILGKGGCIGMYCEGGRSRTGRVGNVARPGIGRLALESGAPVVPVAIHGSSRVRNWKRAQFPSVTVCYGAPVRWEPVEAPTRAQQQEVADQILAEIRALYDRLDSEGRRGVPRA